MPSSYDFRLYPTHECDAALVSLRAHEGVQRRCAVPIGLDVIFLAGVAFLLPFAVAIVWGSPGWTGLSLGFGL